MGLFLLRETTGSHKRELPKLALALMWIIYGHISPLMTFDANAEAHHG
jgi:hypothetical protein